MPSSLCPIANRYRAKADVNAVDSAKDTALMLAVRTRERVRASRFCHQAFRTQFSPTMLLVWQGIAENGGWTEQREGEARASALVRCGATWQGISGISSAEKSRFKALRKEWCGWKLAFLFPVAAQIKLLF